MHKVKKGKHKLAWQVEMQGILGTVQDHPLGACYLGQQVIHHLQQWKAYRGVITQHDTLK